MRRYESIVDSVSVTDDAKFPISHNPLSGKYHIDILQKSSFEERASSFGRALHSYCMVMSFLQLTSSSLPCGQLFPMKADRIVDSPKSALDTVGDPFEFRP